MLKALIYNDLCGPGRELGPYYVEMGPATMSVFMNSSSIRRDELLVFAGSHADQKSKRPIRSLRAHTGLLAVSVQAVAILSSDARSPTCLIWDTIIAWSCALRGM